MRAGPAGWSYKDWQGVVYPADMPRGRHRLNYLSRFFDTIEVNSTFYRPVRDTTCAKWLAETASNPDFMFTVKLWRRFTHERDSWPSDKETREFMDGISPLEKEGKLGAVLAQFPWSFRRTPENSRWLADTIEAFSGYPLVIEVRHASWNTPEFYEALANRHVAFCNIDQPLTRNSIEPGERVTAPVGYVRLHGRNYENWFRSDAGRDDRYNYLYSEDELGPWVERIERMRLRTDEIYVITNNHYRGQAVVNAFELQHRLVNKCVDPPPSLVQAWPRLERLTST